MSEVMIHSNPAEAEPLSSYQMAVQAAEHLISASPDSHPESTAPGITFQTARIDLVSPVTLELSHDTTAVVDSMTVNVPNRVQVPGSTAGKPSPLGDAYYLFRNLSTDEYWTVAARRGSLVLDSNDGTADQNPLNIKEAAAFSALALGIADEARLEKIQNRYLQDKILITTIKLEKYSLPRLLPTMPRRRTR